MLLTQPVTWLYRDHAPRRSLAELVLLCDERDLLVVETPEQAAEARRVATARGKRIRIRVVDYGVQVLRWEEEAAP